MVTKIDAQLAVIQDIESEIEEARQRVVALSQELAALRDAVEPDALSRKAGLMLALELARNQLPTFPPPLAGEWRCKLQQKLERGQDEQDILFHRSWSLSRDIERIEGLEAAWAGRLAEVQTSWQVIAETFNKANFHPEGMSEQMLHGLGMVLSNMEREIGGLPAMCQRLADLGHDADWRPVGHTWQDEIEEEFTGGKE